MSAPELAASSAARAVTFALAWAALWWLLVGADAASWLVGVPAVLVATAFCVAQPARGTRLGPVGALRFVYIFVRDSMRGGLDVSARVLGRQMHIAPGLIEYRSRLGPAGAPFVCFVQCIGLLPGTLVADIDGDRLTVHALDITQPVAEELRRLEDAVGALFALPAAGGPP